MRLPTFTLALGFALVVLPVSVLHARGGGGGGFGGGGHGGGGFGGGGYHGGGGYYGHGGNHPYNPNGPHHWNNYTYNYYPDYYYPPYGYAWYGGPSIVYQNYEDDDADRASQSSGDGGGGGDAPSATLGDAWTALGNGQFSDAEEEFSEISSEHPGDGLPRIGAALALARQGNMPKAVVELRRALHYDPKSINAVPDNDEVNGVIDDDLNRYQGTLKRSSNQADPNFAIACLLYMRGNKSQARAALALAVKAGDDSDAAKNLQKLLSGQ